MGLTLCCFSNEYDVNFEMQTATENFRVSRVAIPGFLRWNVKQALYKAEKRLERPVYAVEVYAEYLRVACLKINNCLFIVGTLHDLYYNHEILADEGFDRFSIDPTMQHKEGN